MVDCQSLAGILNGEIGTKDVRIRSICEETTQMLVELVKRGIKFHGCTSPPFVWRRRQFNKQADYVANTAMDVGKARIASWMPEGGLTAPGWNAVAYSDGGCRRDASSYGWTVLGFHEGEHFELGWWYGPLPCEWDSFSAEAAAAKEVVYAIILLTCDKDCRNKEEEKQKTKEKDEDKVNLRKIEYKQTVYKFEKDKHKVFPVSPG